MNINEKIISFYTNLPLPFKILSVVIAIAFGVLITLNLFPKPETTPTPATTKTQEGTINAPITQKGFLNKPTKTSDKKILNVQAYSPHWLNNTELAYIKYDQTVRQKSLLKTNGDIEVPLIANKDLKLSEIFWSKNNDLLVFDYGNPYKTYFMPKDQPLRELKVRGYGFSFLPDGKTVFLKSIVPEGTETPILYDTQKDTIQTLDITLPYFQFTYWNPASSDSALLYDFDQETGGGKLYTLMVQRGQFNMVSQQNVYDPSWSPDGKKIAYLTEKGLYVTNPGGPEKSIYSSESLYMSYTWFDGTKIILSNNSAQASGIWVLDTDTGTLKPILGDLKITKDQKLGLSVSPDKTSLVITTTKDGLILTKNAF